MNLYESSENYLETILILKKKQGAVRSVDIANHLEFSKPSVSVAMKKLRENGCIATDDDGYIDLTPSGLAIAETMLERHNLVSGWLISIGVDQKIALEDACRIEHVISQQTFERIREYIGKAR